MRWSSLLLPIATTLAACYVFIGRYDNDRIWHLPLKADGREELYLQELAKCPLNRGVELTDRKTLVRRARPGDKPLSGAALQEALGGPLLLRFALSADVHIREPSVKLFNDRESRTLDRVIEAVERHPAQELFQPAVYMATLKAVNALPGPERPRFLVNLGDAIDAGTIGEMYEFVYISQFLRVPWLNVVGNHDDSIFGNYRDRLGYTRTAGADFYPVGNLRTFLFMHSPGPRQSGDLSWRLLPRPTNEFPDIDEKWDVAATPECVAAPVQAAPRHVYSLCHGFDLPRQEWNRDESQGRHETECDRYRGYYSFAVKGCDGRDLQLLALDATRKETWGAAAQMDDEQYRWLEERRGEPASATLIFMHHQPGDLKRLEQAIHRIAEQRPVVVLSAHLHAHHLLWHGGRVGFWEVNTGSVEEFPQWVRLLELRAGAGNRLYLNARTLRPATGPAGALDLPRAELDRRIADCHRVAAIDSLETLHRDPRLSCTGEEAPDPARYPNLLEASAECGYLGAIYDHRFDHPLLSKPSSQPEAEAWREANVVIELSPR